MRSTFVTGATGLLGNNLVRELIAGGYEVKALVRSRAKGEQQFKDLPGVRLVVGDMADVDAFAASMQGCDTLFHTAAFFRDNYKGGSHWEELERINVTGTQRLLEHAHAAGIRRFIHTSSIAVLDGAPGTSIDETCLRDEADADDYYRSKILADRVVLSFLEDHPDLHACMVLPGWMWGPADSGPTSSGQLLNDVVRNKLPGLVPGSFSVVDARDVALAQIAAAQHGRRGERYLAAGRHMTMAELVPLLGKIAGVKTPLRQLPLSLLYALAFTQELYARLTGKPILLSMATVRLMVREAGRTHFNPDKSKQELGLRFRPVEQTLTDTLAWYRDHGWFEKR
ncbi:MULTISPECIES: SDR family oxidoreductase [unclassified Pseudomonas]|uniref:SDR family oxidoreductase n=1 Tax=unclassified Pseudomonas TaxID=196821 RepID=UPI000CD1BACF|nr:MULTISPECIES: SDR family oxidoreductase [unclassified Pseudomonas]POA31739.1 oxidoreductase [Pseudomonas sp. GW456-R21]POA68470.1 oxidoreductase [Pseudomonas sp. GW460-R15]